MRRRRAWADTLFSGTSLAMAGQLKFDLLIGLAPTETKTVSRVLIDLTMLPPVTNTANDRTNMAHVAIGVVSQEAFDLQTLPDPPDVLDYPQQGYVYVASKVVYKFADATGVWFHAAVFAADVRGQRKVDRGVLYMTIDNIAVNGGDNIDIFGRVRALCLT